MPTDLSPAEKDDRQVERLINKRPPPSRKRRNKRGPKHDNRRRRMLDKNDPDAKANARDRKASLADIALRVAFPENDKGRGRLLTRADLKAGRILSDDELQSAGYDTSGASDAAFLRSLGYPDAGAASYGAIGPEDMSAKTAAYHGIVQQGHPSGPTNSGSPSDKRYFGKPEFDSIVAHANELLKTDWLKYSWDGGAEDAPVRAALDLAIHMANSNAYQGKIDVETYNMLLARLTKSKVDLFSETLIPEGGEGKRSAATMSQKNPAIENMVRIANDLRKTNPRQALEIMKNVRSLRVAQVPVEAQVQHQAEEEVVSSNGMPSFEAPKKPGGLTGPGPGKHFDKDGNEQDGDAIDGDKTPPAAGGGDKTGGLTKGPNVKDVKAQLDLFDKARTGEQLMEVLTKLAESVKTAGSRVATSAMEELAPIADMSDEEITKLVQSGKRDVTKLEEVLKGYDETKALSPEEVEAFVKGIDDFINGIVGEAEKAKVASVPVSVQTLLRVASISPEARMVVMPYLAAAKKKMDKAKAKKKGKKKPAKKKDAPKKGGNPFAKGGPLSKGGPPAKGGKKGPPAKGGKGKPPPFGGKKAPPFGKKKASVEISSDDTKW